MATQNTDLKEAKKDAIMTGCDYDSRYVSEHVPSPVYEPVLAVV